MILRQSFVRHVVVALAFGCAQTAGAQPLAPRVLTPGVSVARELASGQSHAYEIALDAGQFTVVTVKGRDAVPALSVIDPAGRLMIETTVKQVSVVAAAKGRYAVQVRANSPGLAPGPYELTLEVPRPAGAPEMARAAGDRALSDAMPLMPQRSAASNQQAFDKLTAAISSFRLAGHRWGEALALSKVGQLYQRAPDMTRARTTLAEALAIARSIEDVRLEGECLFALGTTYSALLERRRGLEYYEQALALFEAIGDPGAQAIVLASAGIAWSDLREYRTAVDTYDRALRLATSAGDLAQVARIHNSLGLTHQQLGEGPIALGHYRQALPLSRSTGNVELESMVINNTGLAYRQLGDFRQALESYNQSLVLVRKLGNPSNEAQLLNNIGNVQKAEGRPEESLASFDQALSMFRRLAARAGEATALNNMGSAYYQLAQYQKALGLHLQSRDIRKTLGDRRGEASALNYAGVAWHKLGEPAQALNCLRESLEIRRQTSDPQGEAETLLNIAIVERDGGSLQESRATLEAALAITESFRSRIADAALRASYVARVQETYASYVDVLMRLHAQTPAAGYDVAAFQAAERTRARVLLESLVEAREDIRQGADPGLLERERALQQQIDLGSEQLSRSLSGASAAGQSGAARKELESLTVEYQQVQAQIRASSPRYAALTQPEPLTAARIQQDVLDDETVLLEFALGETQSWLWAVTKDEVVSLTLPGERVLEAAARSLYAELTARQPRGKELATVYAKRVAAADRRLRSQAAEVSRMLFSGIAEELQGPWRGKRLVIVAAGALEYLPFGSLPMPAVAGGAAAKVSVPLIAHHEIVGVPSASVLLTLRRERAARAPARRAVAVLADPVFEATDPRIARAQRSAATSATASPAPRSTPESSYFATRTVQRIEDVRGGTAVVRLPFSRDEADAITSLAGQKDALRAIDFDASRANALEGSLEDYRIVHFATHGLIDSEQPELSGLILSLVDARGQPQDGLLRLPDIFNMTLKADLVVLSACQTALGQEIRGEGLVGLTRGFMYAGAPRVVASLWQVSDVATAELMKKFYAGMLQKRLPAAAALRAAQLEMSRNPRWTAPYFWAGFVLQGDWR